MRAFLSTSCLCCLLMGCTTMGEAEDAGSATIGSQAGSFGIVRVEREMEPDGLTAGPRAVLGAAFAQYRGVDGLAVVGLLGGRMTTVETCVLGQDEAAAFVDPSAEVELLDAGEIEVTVAGTRTRMLARMFPDLAGMVAGAFYAEDATLGPARADLDEYAVRAEGGDIPAFDVIVVAPQGFTDVSAAGQDAGALADHPRAVDLELSWDGGDPRDRVEIDVVAGGDVLECLTYDDGAFGIPASALGRLQADEEARVVLRRVRTQAVDVPTLDATWVSVASARTFQLVLR